MNHHVKTVQCLAQFVLQLVNGSVNLLGNSKAFFKVKACSECLRFMQHVLNRNKIALFVVLTGQAFYVIDVFHRRNSSLGRVNLHIHLVQSPIKKID